MFSNIVDKDFVVNLVRLACESVEAVGATLYTVDPTRRFLKPFVIHKLPQSYIDGIGTVEVGKQCCGRAVAEKKPWVVQDMLSDPLFRDGAKGALNSQIRAAFSVPVITAKGDAVGSLACHFREPRLPSASENIAERGVRHTHRARIRASHSGRRRLARTVRRGSP